MLCMGGGGINRKEIVRMLLLRLVFCEKTEVTFYELSDKEIDDYIRTGDCFDKAGAYGIQSRGCTLVKKINGDYFNVVGLPIAEVVRRLAYFR